MSTRSPVVAVGQPAHARGCARGSRGARWRRSGAARTTAARRPGRPGRGRCSARRRCGTRRRPRSSQKRMTSCIASTTSGLSQLRSGCSGRNWCRYHCSVPASHVQAGPPSMKAPRQLLGGRVGTAAVAPDVPVPLGVVAARSGGQEPRVLVGGVVGHEVDHDADADGVGLRRAARSKRGQVAEERVDVAVVGHVVAEVGHRRPEERATARRRRRPARRGGRGAGGRPSRSPTPSPSASANDRG